MFSYIFRKFRYRILFAVLAAWPASFFMEIVFSLQYDRYVIYKDLNSYLFAVLAIYIFSEFVGPLNRSLNRSVHWQTKPVRRLILQFLAQALVAIIIVNGGKLLFTLIFKISSFVLLSDEVTIALLTLFLVMLLNILDFSMIMLNQWRYSLAEAEKYRKESAEFEFEMLRSQVNPHFLFNSLNTLSSLVYEDPDKASEFIRKLSDVYRHVLDNRKNELIKVSDEIVVLEAYVYLLELRFSDKLKVTIQLSTGSYQRMVAPLTLQMLLENAVKHNVVSTDEPLRIDIYDEDEYLVVRNVLQLKQNSGLSTGMGLHNISSRYEVISDREVAVLQDNDSFTVKIPLI